jgi:hypothetical protein
MHGEIEEDVSFGVCGPQTNYLRFLIRNLLLACSIVDTKGEIGFAKSWFSISGTDITTRVLAEFTSITFYGIKSMITVTGLCLFPVLLAFPVGHTLGSMQTDMISSWTNFKLMLALNAKEAIWTDTMLPKAIVRLVKSLKIFSEFGNQRSILLSTAAPSVVLANQVAGFFFGRSVWELANGTVETCGTIATFVPANQTKSAHKQNIK